MKQYVHMHIFFTYQWNSYIKLGKVKGDGEFPKKLKISGIMVKDYFLALFEKILISLWK